MDVVCGERVSNFVKFKGHKILNPCNAKYAFYLLLFLREIYDILWRHMF